MNHGTAFTIWNRCPLEVLAGERTTTNTSKNIYVDTYVRTYVPPSFLKNIHTKTHPASHANAGKTLEQQVHGPILNPFVSKKDQDTRFGGFWRAKIFKTKSWYCFSNVFQYFLEARGRYVFSIFLFFEGFHLKIAQSISKHVLRKIPISQNL